jgi:hypothetical protein
VPEPGRDSGAADRDPPGRVRRLLSRHGWLAAIALLYLYVFPYFPRIHSANELPRVYLVKAIVHDGTFAIDHGVRQWGATADVSPSRGHQYSNKAPGSSLLVVPIYAAVSAATGEPSLAETLWLCRIVAGVIPTILFLLLLGGFLTRYASDPDIRRLVVIAYALGSMAMTYSLLYYSHQLAAICIASAWIFAIRVIERERGELALLAVGGFAGASVLVDYQAAFAGVPIAVYLIVQLVRTRNAVEVVRGLALALIGAAVPIAILLAYHAVCFGSPLRTGYDASETFAHFHQQGFLGITKLRSEALWGSLFAADNGLLSLSPWWLLAIPGGVVLWRRDRPTVLVASAIAVIFIAFVSSITFWRGGWGVGPRYITAMLPFLLPLVAALFVAVRGDASTPRRELLLGVLCAPIVSAVVIYVASSATFPYWPDSLRNPLYEVTFRLLGDGVAAPNAASTLGVPLAASAVIYLAGAAALLGWAIRRVAGWRGLAVATVGGAAIIAAFALVPPTGSHADRAYTNTVLPAVTAVTR